MTTEKPNVKQELADQLEQGSKIIQQLIENEKQSIQFYNESMVQLDKVSTEIVIKMFNETARKAGFSDKYQSLICEMVSGTKFTLVEKGESILIPSVQMISKSKEQSVKNLTHLLDIFKNFIKMLDKIKEAQYLAPVDEEYSND